MSELEPPVENTDFSADRRRADGSRTYWATTLSDEGCRLTRWDVENNSWAEASSTSAATWIAAVAGDAALMAVRSDEVTRYNAPDSHALLDVLHPEGRGNPEDAGWPTDCDNKEFEDDDDMVYDDGHIRRWATVNGERLSWAESESTPVAFLGDWDGFEGEQLAYFRWDNGWGCGHSDLMIVREGVAIETSWVDQGETILRSYRIEPGPEGAVWALVSWTDGIDWPAPGQALLALALEPLDPDGMLTAEQLAGWTEAVDGVGGEWGEYLCAIDLSTSDEVNTLLRASFAGHGTTYDRIRTALANPIEGAWLLTLLSEWDTAGGVW